MTLAVPGSRCLCDAIARPAAIDGARGARCRLRADIRIPPMPAFSLVESKDKEHPATVA